MSQDPVTITVNSFIPDLPHNGKLIFKVAISPQMKYVLTYSQEDKTFVRWLVSTNTESFDLRIDAESSKLEEDISDFKISDSEIILYDCVGLVTFKNNSSATINPTVLIYELMNKNELAHKVFYVFNEKDVRFGGFRSNRMWMMAYGLIFLLDLATFQLQEFLLFEKNLNIEKVKYKFSKKLIIMKVSDAHYIYSNNIDHINFPIGKIVDTDCQEFEFKSNLKGTISFNKLVEFDDLDKSIHIEFIDQRVFVVSPEKLCIFNITKHDWRNSIFKDMNDYDDNKMKVVDEYVKDKIPENIQKTLRNVIFNLYDNCELNSLEIKCLADPSENESKKQLINYLLNAKYYFVIYGEILLKSAIKQNNLYLIGGIFNKTIEYFRENPRSNICILS
ncbi:13495_t:CDS:2, partial [Funneliformis mosseae]